LIFQQQQNPHHKPLAQLEQLSSNYFSNTIFRVGAYSAGALRHHDHLIQVEQWLGIFVGCGQIAEVQLHFAMGCLLEQVHLNNQQNIEQIRRCGNKV